VALDQAGDQARGFGVLDEVVEKTGAGLVRLRGTDRLLHGGKPAIENSRAAQLLDILQQAWSEAGQGVQLIRDELLERGIEAARSHQLGVAKVTAQPEIVGAPRRDCDAHARTVDIRDGPDRRACGHELGSLDQA
jgi:hypothetical protein